jgi:predicted DNA-binding protein
LLVEPELYQRLKMMSNLKHIPMSQIIRDGIRHELDKMDRENPNAFILGEQ